MTKLHVVVGYSGADENVEEYEGERVTFMTEPSGVLIILRSPGEIWAAFAPGSWKKVRDVDEN